MRLATAKTRGNEHNQNESTDQARRIFAESGLFFLLGAILYPMIELAWRRRTHISMALLGGLCLLSIRLVDRGLGKGRWAQKALLSALLITELEFLCGVLVNLVFKLEVWDYSKQPLHLLGQICPLFSFFWFLLSFPALLIFHCYDKKTQS